MPNAISSLRLTSQEVGVRYGGGAKNTVPSFPIIGRRRRRQGRHSVRRVWRDIARFTLPRPPVSSRVYQPCVYLFTLFLRAAWKIIRRYTTKRGLGGYTNVHGCCTDQRHADFKSGFENSESVREHTSINLRTK